MMYMVISLNIKKLWSVPNLAASSELITFCENEEEKTVAASMMNPVSIEVPVSILMMLKLVGPGEE